MRKKIIFIFSLIVLSIIGCLSVPKQSLFADSITATFDYNTSRIQRYLPNEMTKNLTTQECEVSGLYAEEPININQSILYYYDYEWTVDGVSINLNDYVVTKDTTFVANWTPKQYTIYYNYMTEKEKGEIVNFQLVDKYSVESPVVFYRPKRAHYAFIDWYSSAAFHPNEICIYTDTYAIGDKVLYAKWQPIEYYINYHTDASNKDNPYSYNIDSPDYELTAPQKDGHIFRGWYLDENCTYEYSVIENGSYGNLDLYPLWELEKYEVKYTLPNGEKQSVFVEYGHRAESPKNYNNMFELVLYDGDRNNITGNMEITVTYVNVWYLYVIGLVILVAVIIAIIFAGIHKRRQLHKLRYIYHSNQKRK